MAAGETRRRWSRSLWNLGGAVSLALAILGIPLPLLPTTPFLLLAAACYLRGSPRMHRWLLTNPTFGRYLADYRAGRGVPRRTKIAALALLWLAIGASAVFAVEAWPIRGLLLAIAVAVSLHLLLIRPRRPPGRRDD